MRSLERLWWEAWRLEWMLSLEGRANMAGYERVAGLDEAGRGAWAGPVVVAAVIPNPRRSPILGVNDSKQLDARSREVLARRIQESCLGFAVAHASAREVDSDNVLAATRRAMSRALSALRPEPDLVLVDAVSLPDSSTPCLPLVRGDSWSYAIACASILAKVERDRRMTELDSLYPAYGFARHKGYGVPEHRSRLERYGPCPEHRLSYGPVVSMAGRGAA